MKRYRLITTFGRTIEFLCDQTMDQFVQALHARQHVVIGEVLYVHISAVMAIEDIDIMDEMERAGGETKQ